MREVLIILIPIEGELPGMAAARVRLDGTIMNS